MLQRGLELHRVGMLADAEALYKAVLEQDPTCAHGLHFLAVLRMQQEKESQIREGQLRLQEAERRAQIEAGAKLEETAYRYYQRDESAQQMTLDYRQRNPAANFAAQPIRVYDLR